MKIVFVINNAAFFVSHRLSIALAARAAGHQVALICGQAGSPSSEAAAVARLAEEGVEHYSCAFTSAGLNPVVEVFGLLQLIWRMRSLSPDIVHCASPKGLLYGGVAARLTRVQGLVLAVSGMGYLFTAGNAPSLRRALRTVYSKIVRYAYGHQNKRVIVQNHDDFASVLESGLARSDELVRIPGSGIRLHDFLSITDEHREDIVVLPARLLKDKGILEFAQAAIRLRASGLRWRFVLAGAGDHRNPSAVSEEMIRELEAAGAIEWWGRIDDMPQLYRKVRVVCLPSYREGMPKVLLEAAAAGCAVVTTDVVGCREAIVKGLTGELVPVADAGALADALQSLIADPVRMQAYGAAGRKLAIEKFDIELVISRVLTIYDELAMGAAKS